VVPVTRHFFIIGVTLMRPSSANAAFGTRPYFMAAVSISLLLAAAGCTRSLFSEDLSRRVAENACINRCQNVKDQCDADARFDYQQCQAGYQAAQRTLRWCNASDQENCGYPWWSCSENLYGFCTNRYWECHTACRRPRS
jgi:hypothetical protein